MRVKFPLGRVKTANVYLKQRRPAAPRHPDRSESVPEFLRSLPAQADEVIINGREFDLRTRQHGKKIYYFLFDESEFEAFEQRMLAAIIILVLGLIVAGTLSGYLLAQRIITPLRDLASTVSTLGPGVMSTRSLESFTKSDHEIAFLASAISRYHTTNTELLIREQEFSADVSHELRTPIMAIQSAADLLQSARADNHRFSEVIDRIKRGCFHMAALTEALLYLARDPQSFNDLVEPISIKSVVDSQLAAVKEVAERKGIELMINDANDGTVNAIPAVLDIVIGNILKNAVKYTDQHIINVFIEDDEVVIQDYGPGIDLALQENVFKRFDRGQSKDSDGSGIGLALVRRVCEQYGWVIDFRSDKESGTRVSVAFA